MSTIPNEPDQPNSVAPVAVESSTVTPAAVELSTVATEAVRTSMLKRIGDKHQQFSNWATFGAFCIAFFGLVIQFIQLQELHKSQKDTDKQVESLRLTFEKARALEIAPRLLVECPEERIHLSGAGKLLKEAKIRIRNIGRGAAHHVVITVKFHELRVGETIVNEWKKELNREEVISQRTIPAGESLPFDEFKYPLAKATLPQGLSGTVGLYCTDDENHEFVFTQIFLFIVHLEEGDPHAHLSFLTPTLHPERFEIRENGTKKRTRTVSDVLDVLDYFVQKALPDTSEPTTNDVRPVQTTAP